MWETHVKQTKHQQRIAFHFTHSRLDLNTRASSLKIFKSLTLSWQKRIDTPLIHTSTGFYQELLIRPEFEKVNQCSLLLVYYSVNKKLNCTIRHFLHLLSSSFRIFIFCTVYRNEYFFSFYFVSFFMSHFYLSPTIKSGSNRLKIESP